MMRISRFVLKASASPLLVAMFLKVFSPIASSEETSQTVGDKYSQKYFLLYQYVAEKKTEDANKREEEKKEETSRKKVTSYFKYWGKYGEYDSNILPDEKQKEKFDKEGKWKPILTEKDTLCVPPCIDDADPKEKSYVKIYPIDPSGNLYEAMTFSCEMIGKEGFVGPVRCAIEEIKFSKGEVQLKDRVCPARGAYVLTETKVSEGVVEERDLAWTLGRDGKKMVQVPVRYRYLGNRSRKETNMNRSVVDPCGFAHGICFDPFLGLDWDDEQMCPCEELPPPPPPPPPPPFRGEPDSTVSGHDPASHDAHDDELADI